MPKLKIIFAICFLLPFVCFTEAYSKADSMLSSQENLPYKASLSWRFFPNELLSPTEALVSKEYRRLSSKTFLTPQDSGFHWGTYQTSISLKGERAYSMYLPTINSATKIWVNNVLTFSKGNVSENKDLHIGDGAMTIINLPRAGGEVIITIQFSNYDTVKSGIVDSVYIGEVNLLNKLINKRIIMSVGFIGVFILISILLLTLFLYFRRNIDYLYLSIISTLVMFRSLFTYKSYLYISIFDNWSFDIKNRIIYLSAYLILIALPLYINATFRVNKRMYITYLFVSVGATLSIATLLLPVKIYGGVLLDIAHLFFLLEIGYTIYIFWLNRAKASKRVVVVGLILCFPLVIVEMLKNSGVINLSIPFLLEFSLLIFFLFQIILLARKNSKTFTLIESLNKSLEEQVERRTRELVDSNKVKESLLSVISHDLRGPMGSLKGVLSMFNSGYISEAEIKPLIKQMETELYNTDILLENILRWSMSQSVNFKPEKRDYPIHQLISEYLPIFNEMAQQKEIKLINHVASDSLFVKVDRNIIQLAIRNLLSNAIKFTRRGGEIRIIAERDEGGSICLKITDNGVGMSPEQVNKFLNNENQHKVGTEREQGHGLGLKICKEFLNKMGAKINLSSVAGQGTTFIIYLEEALLSKEPVC